MTFLDIYRFSFNNGDATISCFETLLAYAEPAMKGNNAADFISQCLIVWSTATPFVVKGNNIWCVAACGYGSLEKWQQIQRCSFDIKGILPKGPYLPCVSMAGGPFWQDTIDIHESWGTVSSTTENASRYFLMTLIGSGSGLALTNRQAVTWANDDDPAQWLMLRHRASMIWITSFDIIRNWKPSISKANIRKWVWISLVRMWLLMA